MGKVKRISGSGALFERRRKNAPREAAGRFGRGGAELRHLYPLVGCSEGREMWDVEIYAAVRLAVADEGLSHHDAGRRFGMYRRTVKKMLSYSAPPGYRRTAPVVKRAD